jgi:D-glycero-alpha-D-manno-heptose-7-phosphate kinase
MIISRTPYRISFFGGGTDYPDWYKKHGGAVLATTVNKYCYISCRYLPPFFKHRFRVAYSKIEDVETVDEIMHPAVREALRHMKIDDGLEVHNDGDLPARSGIGSSSSFSVGLLHALHALKGRMPSKKQLAEEGMYLEHDLLKETVGCQDQIMAAYGGFNHITFHTSGGFSVRPMTLSHERIREFESHLMLFYTGIERTASDIADSYVGEIQNKEQELMPLGKLVEDSIALLNSDNELSPFGELLHQAWQLKRSLSTKVSNPAIDAIYEEARAAGAIGGKLLGAGGGGFLLLFIRPAYQERVRKKLHRLLHVPFRFEFAGSQIIFHEPEQDYSVEERAFIRGRS